MNKENESLKDLWDTIQRQTYALWKSQKRRGRNNGQKLPKFEERNGIQIKDVTWK